MNIHLTKSPKGKHRKKRKSNHRSRKYQAYLKRQRAKAAHVKAKRAKHRRKHPQQQMNAGVMVMFASYIIARIKIREHLSCIYCKKKSNSKFSVIDIIVGLVALIAFGVPRIYDIAKYKEHRLLARALQMDRMFSHDTVYRFLKKFATLTMCRLLQKANSKMLREFFESQEQIVLDGDWSTIRSYPNKKEGAVKGQNKLRPGRNCYQANAYFANGLYVKADVLAGNQVPIDSLTLFSDLREARRLCGRIDWLRLDAGYISILNLQRLEDFSCQGHSREKIQFIVNVGKGTIGAKEAIRKSSCRCWQKVKNGVYIQDFPAIQVYKDYHQKHRMILVKRYFEQEKKWKYYALITNNNGTSALDLFHFYHKRQCIEYFFDDAKNSYFMEHLPSSKLLGNSLFVNIICLTFNLLVFFRHEVLRKKDQWIQLKTLRRNYLKLDIVWNGQNLIIPRCLPNYRVVLMILRRLEKLNIRLEYRLCG